MRNHHPAQALTLLTAELGDSQPHSLAGSPTQILLSGHGDLCQHPTPAAFFLCEIEMLVSCRYILLE